MPLKKHLVVHMQEMYSTERDYQNYLRSWADQVRNTQLKSMVHEQVEGIDQELQNLRKALSDLGESPKDALKSPIVQALQQEDQTTHQEMPNMTPADMDVHVAMTDIGFGQMEIGFYQGMLSMAKSLNNAEVANLLQQNLEHEQHDVRRMQELLPTLITDSQQKHTA